MVNRERGSRLRRVAGLVAGVGALGLLLGGVATATIPTSTTGQVAACYRVNGGALRVIDVQKKQRCAKGERLLTWGPSWVWRGTYNPKLAYVPGSVVVSNASSYVARVAVPKGRAPSGTGTSYWGLLASVGVHNHDDRYYTEAEGDARYPAKAELLAEVDALKAANAAQDAYIRTVLVGTALVPSGKTVTGYGTFDHSIIGDNEDVYVAVQLPGKATTPLTAATVNFAPSPLAVDDDATCTGTVAAPTAPPGKVCLYIGDSANVDGLAGEHAVQPGFNDQFFLVYGFANGTQGLDLYFRFSWAYRAP